MKTREIVVDIDTDAIRSCVKNGILLLCLKFHALLQSLSAPHYKPTIRTDGGTPTHQLASRTIA